MLSPMVLASSPSEGKFGFLSRMEYLSLSALTIASPGLMYKYMSEDRAPYKRLGQPQEISELDRMSRALKVHRNWIWADGLRIVKLADRVRDLETEMAELKGTLERILTKNMN